MNVRHLNATNDDIKIRDVSDMKLSSFDLIFAILIVALYEFTALLLRTVMLSNFSTGPNVFTVQPESTVRLESVVSVDSLPLLMATMMLTTLGFPFGATGENG
jgi:hypothetical protein